MKLSALLSISGVVSILFGIGFVAVPVAMLAQYCQCGAPPDPHLIFVARLYGAALIQIGVLAWFARNIVDSLGRGAIVLAGLVGMGIGFIVALHGQMHGVMTTLGWSTVVIYALLAIGFAYFQIAPKSS